MDWYTKNALWVYWMRGDNEIETNLFNYETPLCTEFKEFNYLLKVDAELFTHDIERTKTYEDYENELNNEDNEPWTEDGVPYEICDHVCEPFRFKNGKTKWSTCNSNEDGFCNGGEKGKASNNSDVQEKEDEHKERFNLFDNTAHDAPVCKIRRFEMIKYSFGQDEEYVAIKEPINNICHKCNLLHFKNGTAKWPTCNWKEDKYCNTGDLPRFVREGNSIRYENDEWYDTIDDSELKEKALINKATLEESINANEESSDYVLSHYSPIDEWKDYEHTTYIKIDVSSNQNTYNNVCRIIMNHKETQKNDGWFDKHELMGDDYDDISDLEDYLTQNDPPYYVNK
ncbi:hypothetical protein Tco_0863881 [Tanacetum coccineum]